MKSADTEFDRQQARLVSLGYPSAAGLSEREFSDRLAHLREHTKGMTMGDLSRARFVMVIPSQLVPVDFMVAKLDPGDGPGFIDLHPKSPSDFEPIPSVEAPVGSAYLALDVDSGREYLNLTPSAALAALRAQGGSPLTIEEGIALATHFPGSLAKNACFSLAGSRSGDKRVPALWISKGRARLGWCWEGNPHSWLGMASCGSRIVPAPVTSNPV